MTETLPNPCGYFELGVCKSCSLIPVPYPSQIATKQNALSELLQSRLLDAASVSPMVASASTFGSRNKAKFAISGTIEQPTLGFPRSDGNITPVDRCPLHSSELNAVAATIKALLPSAKIPPYHIHRRVGELKYVLLRWSASTSQMSVRFVLRSNRFLENVRALIPQIQREHPSVKVVSVNLQPHPKAIVEGDEEIPLSDAKRIEERLGDIRMLFSPRSFSQTNSFIAQALYQKAAEWIHAAGARNMLDLFCGVGAFSLFAAPHVESATGLEVTEEAIGDAQASAALNDFKNLNFKVCDVDQFAKEERINSDLVLVNPPRRGLSRAVLEAIKRGLPAHVVYSSCSAETLVRDLAELQTSYRVTKVQPFDMFPLTEHFETLVLAERR